VSGLKSAPARQSIRRAIRAPPGQTGFVRPTCGFLTESATTMLVMAVLELLDRFAALKLSRRNEPFHAGE